MKWVNDQEILEDFPGFYLSELKVFGRNYGVKNLKIYCSFF